MGFLDGMNSDRVAANPVVPTRKGDFFTSEQTFDYGQRFGEPINPDCSTIKSETRFVIFRSNTAGAQAKFKTSVRQEIDCRGFTRDEYRMAEVVIENIRADPKMFGCLGGTDQCWYWRDEVGEMIGNG